jgi:hypothetical protein
MIDKHVLSRLPKKRTQIPKRPAQSADDRKQGNVFPCWRRRAPFTPTARLVYRRIVQAYASHTTTAFPNAREREALEDVNHSARANLL